MLTPTQEKFFVLLRAGLWDTPVDIEELGTDVDWKEIYKIAREQTVVGLIADAIGTLPAEQRPPVQVTQHLIMDKLAIEKSHARLNDTLNAITEMLNMEDIPSVLLKGQGVAQNYPHPTSRTCGDIDLYVGKENYAQAISILKPHSDHPESKTEETIKHASLFINGVDIEIHKMATTLDSKKRNDMLQGLTLMMLDAPMNNAQPCPSLDTWNNNGQEINLPEPNFNAVFQLIHMMRHLTEGGIGLRQLCDWTRFLHTHAGKLDATRIQQMLQDLRLEKAWDSITSVCMKYLALPMEDLPIDPRPDIRRAEKIVRIIFTTGNFGHHDAASLKAQDSRYIVHKWKRFCYHIQHFSRVLPLFPRLELQYIGHWFTTGIKVLLQGPKK